MNLQSLFQPKSVAVMGVSLTNDRHPANVIYNKNHLRYPLRVFPVNPKGGTLQRERVYPRIADIPEEIDLAVIAVRAEQVPDAVEACIKENVGGAVVISGGFAETGRKDLQDRMVSIAREAGAFISEMMLPWVHQFAHRLANETQCPFYPHATQLLVSLLNYISATTQTYRS